MPGRFLIWIAGLPFWLVVLAACGARTGENVSPTDGGARVLRVVSDTTMTADQRLIPFGSDLPGDPMNGWDNCQSPTPLSEAPADCSACLPSSHGTPYLRYDGSIPTTASPPVHMSFTSPDSQAYGYFTPPLAADAPQGLWFDLIRIGGDPWDATLTIYATDTGCATLEVLGTWGMSDILSVAQRWQSTCVTVTPHQPASGIGFRFSGSAVLGVDGPRFGPNCPSP